MKRNILLLSMVMGLAQVAGASGKAFTCSSKTPLWGSVEEVQFDYDIKEAKMSLSFEMDGEKVTMTGVIDSSFKPRSKDKIRFMKEDGDSNFNELTSESYICNVMAHPDLLTADSSRGKLNLVCRGESFENAYYNCVR